MGSSTSFSAEPSSTSAFANPEAATIPGRFAEIVRLYGDRPALSTDTTQWTYSELDRLSDRIAHTVADRLGSAPVPVAVLMEHGAPLIAAVLGVLKAGKIYLVVDPLDPVPRLQATTADAGAALILTDAINAVLAASVTRGACPAVELSFDPSSSSKPDWPLPTPSPDDGAWLTYTSGSTGAPKGVWQNHEGTIRKSAVFAELIGIGPGDRISLLTTLNLAASTSSIFAALLTGATLCPFRIRSEGIELLPEWLQRQSITVYHSVPTVFRHLMRVTVDDRCLQSLRVLRLGGEPVRPSDVELYRQRCPYTCRLMLSFSSTETGVIAASLIDKGYRVSGSIVPSGHPVRGVELQIVDEQGNALPRGQEGRIAVRSAHMTQGYWRQPDATAKTFQSDKNHPNSRRFVTNDLGRILEDGNLQHLGRADQVVKIRGRRIDLLEVEEGLCGCAMVEEAAATTSEDGSGDNRLVAFVVLKPGVEASGVDLRRALACLPEHLVPSSFILLDSLPRTAGGKLDRQALKSQAPAPGAALGDGEPPRKGIEQKLASIWERIFGLSPIGRNADFFELGGSSIQSVQMLALISERFNIVLPPSVLLEYSTVEALARVIADERLLPSAEPLVLLRDDPGGQPLFLVHSGEGDLALFGQLIRRLPGRTIYGFQSIGLDGEGSPLRSVEAMARRYVEGILIRDPTGPYVLGGARMGGMVALEMARLLSQRGRSVKLVALLDFGEPRRPRYYDVFMNPIRKAVDRIRIGKWAVIRHLRRNDRNSWLTSYRSFVTRMNCGSRHDYRMKRYPGSISLFLTQDRLRNQPDTLRRYAGDVRTVMVPGGRGNLLAPPAVDIVARELQKHLAEAGA